MADAREASHEVDMCLQAQNLTLEEASAMVEYTISVPVAFVDALSCFETIVEFLRDAHGEDHSGVEEGLASRLDQLGNAAFQAYLDHSFEQEEPRPVRGHDGVVRRDVRKSSRAVESIFSEVRAHRWTIYTPGVAGLHPLDAKLNLPTRKYSYGVQRRIARLSAKLPFDAAIEELEDSTAAHVPKRQFEQVVQEAAVDFSAFYAMPCIPLQDDGRPLYMSCDCKGVVMRPDSLTEYTRKQAAKSEHKLKGRLSIGEKRNRKRMASVTAVYDQSSKPRTPESFFDSDIDSKLPRPENKRVFATVEKPLKQAVREMFDEADRRDPDHRRPWVVLVDGHRQQKKYIRDEARRRGVEVTMVLDIIHVAEYLWKAAWRRFDNGDPAAEEWVQERLLRILQGKASTVAAGIRRSATLRGLTGTARKTVDKVADYFLNNKSLMRYDEYLSAGLAIGTGVIEGACRYLVKDRMEVTGARWGLESAEAVLRLRALVKNGDFDKYWAFHVEQERQRNYNELIPANDNGNEALQNVG